MIKINVITNYAKWFSFIKNPNNYINKKIKKLNQKNKNYNKNILFCTLVLSDNQEIKKLNKKFREKNKSTDVLSFPFHSKKNLKIEIKKKKEIYLGEKIVNLDKVNDKKNLKIFKFQFNKLWVHGLVHLFGHHHKKEEDFKKMSRIEKNFLKYID